MQTVADPQTNNMVRSKARLDFIDIAKGIAILLVPISHTYMQGNGFKLICSINMPLFFFLTGYTFRQLPISELPKAIKKDFVKLITPVAVMSFIYFILDVLLLHTNITEAFCNNAVNFIWGNGCKIGSYSGIGVLWFCWALFWSKTCYRFVLQYVKKYRQMFILFGTVLSFIFSGLSKLPQGIDLVFPIMAFLEAGYLLKSRYDTIKAEKM